MSALLTKLSRTPDSADWTRDKRLLQVARQSLAPIRHDHVAHATSVRILLAGVAAKKPLTFEQASTMVQEHARAWLIEQGILAAGL